MKFLAHLWINCGLLTCCTEFYCFFWAYLYIVLWNHLIRVHSPFMGLSHQNCCFWFCYGIILYIHRQKLTVTKDKKGSQKTNYDSNDYFLCWKTWWYHWLYNEKNIHWKNIYSFQLLSLYLLSAYFLLDDIKN